MNKISKIFGTMVVVVAIIAITIPVSAKASYLTVGSRGYEVSKLQEWLISNGFPIPLIQSGVANTGYFGSQTKEAVMMYQESKGVNLTGSINTDDIFNPQPSPVLGAVSGPDFYYPYFAVNNVASFYEKKSLYPATTTPCAIRSPINATSTLLSSTFSVRVATSTATTITIATSTDAFSTTTLGATFSLASGAQGSFAYGNDVRQSALIAPGSYVVWGVAGFVPADTSKFLGSCTAEFRTI